MTELSFQNLFVVCAAAATVPLLLGYAPRIRVPSVVLEIGAGVVLGPAVLGWVEVDLAVEVLSWLGLAFLLFLAGLEIDPAGLLGPRLRMALLGYLITLVLATLVAVLAAAVGWVSSPALLVVALSSTSLGLVVPILKDAERVGTPMGQALVVGSTVADVGSIVALSVFFGAGSNPAVRIVFAAVFGAAALILTLSTIGVRRSVRLHRVLADLQRSTAQIYVRLSMVLLVGLTALAGKFGLETILGAFVAGVVLSALTRGGGLRLRGDLDAVGFGFLVPVFYVTTGLQLDVVGLFEGEDAALRVPVFVLALLLIRGLPAMLYLRVADRRSVAAAALLQATSLPVIVTATQVGLATNLIDAVTGAALVAAGVVSVAIFPTVAYGLLGAGQAQRGAKPPPARQDA